MKRIFTYSLIFAAGLGFAGCTSSQFNMNQALTALGEGMQAASISDQDMALMARQTVQALDAKNKIAPANSPYTKRLNRLTKGLTQVNGMPLNFKVYLTDDVNAFACPDGSVRVYSGLMDMMDDDEVLGVIGHEIGHVAKHHSKKAFQEQLMSAAILDGIGSTGNVAAALTQSDLARLGQTFANAHYSQKQESQADDCGYDFLVANGRNPWGIVEAFEKLQAMENGNGARQNELSKMFSDHPDTQKRIKAMENRCIRDGYKRPSATASSPSSSVSNSSSRSSYSKVKNTKNTIVVHSAKPSPTKAKGRSGR